MKKILALNILVLSFGLAKAQSNREDIVIQWPETAQWKLDQSLSIQTDFSKRHQAWYLKDQGKESWQEMVGIVNEDIIKSTKSLDSIKFVADLSNANGTNFKVLAEKKNGPVTYKLLSIENRKFKSDKAPISSIVYITDGKTCRHVVMVSVKTAKFSADFLKQWSGILLQSRIIPTISGNFEYTDDAYLDIKETDGIGTVNIIARFKSDQIQHLLKGQLVKVVVDEFPELSLSGKVSEISKEKNEENGFVLTSPDTQSGNFVKIIQRLPVTITAEIPAEVKAQLKNRMNCRVSVATTPR
ncbi:hypothetical protein TH53_19340 [Pedobacter lusitanus]|uniref:HlyD family secretion protein n=1 Tax=Pedobacter lusitanus TaxID=1503925 RepID=A0A0D0F1Z7_9SPHI|nr:hypothetical protein [Pedobacter lusitanus]KIO75643.1 hypothetical protein TH53_19340 [Pedobacter lusitanus]